MSVKRKRRVIFGVLVLLGVLMAVAFFMLRGPYVSNLLKKSLLADFEAATGYQVMADRMYINLFPLFVRANGVRAFDEKGEKVFTAKVVKGYFELWGVFRRRVMIPRVVLSGPRVWLDDERVRKIKGAFDGLGGGSKRGAGAGVRGAGVEFRVIEVRDGEFSYYDGVREANFTGRGIDVEAIFKRRHEIIFSAEEVAADSEGWPELRASLRGRVLVRGSEVELKGVRAGFFGSRLELSGLYSNDRGGEFTVQAEVLMESLKRSFGLSRDGRGKIEARGTVTLARGFSEPAVDLDIEGEFYIETLMELLRVRERVEGWIEVKGGGLKGRLGELTGTARARLTDGNLFNLDVDEVLTDVSYGDRWLKFSNGGVDFYGGSARAEVELLLPRVNRYSVSVDVSGVESTPFFKLIDFDIGIPEGRVSGSLRSSGEGFNPDVRFSYSAEAVEGDVLDRVREVTGLFHMRDGVLKVVESEARTGKSTLRWTGIIDLNRRELALSAHLDTVDLLDLSAPYFTRHSGAGRLQATVSGPIDDPLVRGTVKLKRTGVDDLVFGDLSGVVSYRKGMLQVKDLKGAGGSLDGTIEFTGAAGLFDLSGPVFDLRATLAGADIKGIAAFLHKVDLPVRGTLEADFTVKGPGPHPLWSGEAAVTGAGGYGFRAQSVRGGFSFDYGALALKDAVVENGGSSVRFSGRVSMEGEFEFRAQSDGATVSEFYRGKGKGAALPVDSTMVLKARGSGTFSEPEIFVEAELLKSSFRGRSAGTGSLSAALKGRRLSVEAELFGRRLALTGGAVLEGRMPWTAKVDIPGGRYDSLLSGFMKEVPPDMLLSLKGAAELSGDRERLSARARFTQASVSMFNQSFTNSSDIIFDYDGERVTVSSLSLKSGNTSFNLSGDFVPGKSVNLLLDGSTSLSPLTGFFDWVDVIKGSSDYVFSIQGGWERPVINGGLVVKGGTLAIKDVPYRLTSIDSYIYVADNKVVIDELEAGLGGGDVGITGMVQMDGLTVRNFYLVLLLGEVTASVRRGLVANVSGNMVWRGEPGAGEVVGELTINRARYRDMIEWKSWLIKAKKRDTLRAGAGRFADTELNVAIHGSDNIIIDNNIVDASLEVDLTVGGTIGDPLLLGRVVSSKGKVYFRNNVFDILTATADFADPGSINPVIEVQAETTVNGYTIRLGLDGQLDRFNLKLSSDPPLEDVEILGLLTVGDFGENLKGLEGGIGAAEATAFLTGEFQDVLEERLRYLTGIDRIQINPYVSKSTGAVTPRVTLSKRLLGERLFVTYSTAVSTEKEQIVKLEYILKKNVSLIGIRDERGSMGGDVKFRFEFR